MTIKNINNLEEVKEGDFLVCVQPPNKLAPWWTANEMYEVLEEHGVLYILDDESSHRYVKTLHEYNPVRFVHIAQDTVLVSPSQVDEDDTLVCINSQEDWYTVSKEYHVYQDKDGDLLIDDDEGDVTMIDSLCTGLEEATFSVIKGKKKTTPKEDTTFKSLDQVQEGDYLSCEDTDNTPWWTVNKKYKVHTNNNGVLCVKDDEGDNRTLTNIIQLSNFLRFSVIKGEKKQMNEPEFKDMKQVNEGDYVRCVWRDDDFDWWTEGQTYKVFMDCIRGLCITDGDGETRSLAHILSIDNVLKFSVVKHEQEPQEEVQEVQEEVQEETPIMIDVEKLIEHITQSGMGTEELVNYLEGYKEGILSK